VASAGDVVFVYSGIYRESIGIDKPLVLVGEDAETTVILGPGIGDVVRVSSDGVQVSGFTVKNSGGDFAGPFTGGDAGIKLSQVQNVRIANMIVTENSLGIFLDSSEHNEIGSNTCSSNGKEGIYLRLSNSNVVRDNTCESNGGHGGIYVVSSSSNVISNNTCSSNPDHGIKLQRSSDYNQVEDNTCSGNGNAGVFLVNSQHNTIVHNVCTRNGDGVFIRLSDANVVADNVLRSNTSGVSLNFASFDNVIRDNTCSDNGFGIWLRLSSNNNRLIGNVCSSNRNGGISIDCSNDNEISYNTLSLNGNGVSFECGERIQIGPGEWTTWDGFVRMEGYFAKFKEQVATRGITLEGKNCVGNTIRWNSIQQSINPGIEGKGPTEVDAVLNWWGDRSGPYHPTLNDSGQGNEVRDFVLFEPWLRAPLELRKAQEVKEATTTCIDARSEADAVVTITTRTGGAGLVYVAAFVENPGEALPAEARAIGKWVNVGTEIPADEIEWPITIKVYYTDAELVAAGVEEDSLRMYCWNWDERVWRMCPETGVDPQANFVWVEAQRLTVVAPMVSPAGGCNARVLIVPFRRWSRVKESHACSYPENVIECHRVLHNTGRYEVGYGDSYCFT
jgi:parallel beta-helix repeat protein